MNRYHDSSRSWPSWHSTKSKSPISVRKSLGLLLRGRLGLGSLLPVASDHDDAQEGTHDGGAQQNEDDGYANGPDTRREEVLQRVVRVDEGLIDGASQRYDGDEGLGVFAPRTI